ncbi:hypothetical protein EW145_g6464 [Phellinidium pouzarii]|uniref:Integrase catalytic domain-containing protein n=1 Tax=Phellinidium pouzarii TaxID=167371 RepID=A0A4S4KYC1_9AGAM|nr:hypothetical protein EW145_g6464 [Phellinidium pouzarii]
MVAVHTFDLINFYCASLMSNPLLHPGTEGLPATAAQLKSAQLRELKYWAKTINEAHIHANGRSDRPFSSVSNATKDNLCKSLAVYFSFDLDAPIPMAIQEDVKAEALYEERIFREQYNAMTAAAKAWGMKEPYNFPKQSTPAVQQSELDMETHEARSMAQAASITISTSLPSINTLNSLQLATFPPITPAVPIPAISEASTSNSTVLSSLEQIFEGLNRANGLKDAIEQGKSGQIQYSFGLTTTPPLTPIPADPSALPFQSVSIDFITDLPLSNSFDSLMVIVDHDSSKGIILCPCNKTIDALGTALLYHQNVYRRFGLPKCIKSKLSTAYHPQTDGQMERANQEIKAYLRIYCGTAPNTWAKSIPDLEFSHNLQTHSVTKTSPFNIILGYSPIPIPPAIEPTNLPSLSERLHLLTTI